MVELILDSDRYQDNKFGRGRTTQVSFVGDLVLLY
jgi:hypothetical protein